MDLSEETRAVVNLFSGSHNQTLLNPDFKVAGRDFIVPTFAPTINVSLCSPQGTASSNCTTDRDTRPYYYLQTSTSPPPPTTRSPTVKTHGPTGFSQFVGSLRRLVLQDKPNQVEISPLDGASARPPTFLTTPDVYVLQMLRSGKGLPCWQPRPWKPLASESGTVPGDVGIYGADSGFRRLFNIWGDDEAVRYTGQLYSETVYQLPEGQVVTAESGLEEGDAVVHGTSSEISWADDGLGIKSFEFECRSTQGAVLAITSPTKLQELADSTALREHIAQNAELLYRHANTICRIADTEALYVITGCIKSETWALAAFNDPTTSPADTLKLVKRLGVNRHGNTEFTWTRRGTSEARVGKSEVMGESDQSLFLRGFKLDASLKFRSKMRATEPRTLSHGFKANCNCSHPSSKRNAGARLGHGHRNSSCLPGCDHAGSGILSFNLEKLPLGRLPAAEKYTSNGSHREVHLGDPRPGYDSPHPCDHINQYLLENAGADFALSHDDDWLALLDDPEGDQPIGDIATTDGVASLSWGPIEEEEEISADEAETQATGTKRAMPVRQRPELLQFEEGSASDPDPNSEAEINDSDSESSVHSSSEGSSGEIDCSSNEE